MDSIASRMTPCAFILKVSLCIAVSVLWISESSLGWAVALLVLCHFDDSGLSSADHSVRPLTLWRRPGPDDVRTGNDPLLCDFDDGGLPLHPHLPGVWIHGLLI